MKNNNIVIFSSGTSEKSGILQRIQSSLSLKGYNCSVWRNLFANANDLDNIALLPMLIKKIPTFDYAVLICESHDFTTIYRNSESFQVKTMRDNVLFEIGLCAMALGLNRTILLTDKDVRLPDDLMGKNNTLALKQIFLTDTENTSSIVQQIDDYITQTGDVLHQVIIGAATSTACGYITNFICRILECINEEIHITENGVTKSITLPLEKIYLDIILPETITPAVLEQLQKDSQMLLKGCIPNARNRPVFFACHLENDELHIIDYPTSIVTSYDTAKIILNMDADDTLDVNAAQRFTTKELNLYESTLKTLLTPEFITQVVDDHYSELSNTEKSIIISRVCDVITNRLEIIRR